MRIALVGSGDSLLKIFPELIDALAKEVPDLEPDEFFAPTALDIPMQLKELEDFDFVFVFYAFGKEEFKAKVLAEKLVEFELQSGMKIIKGLEKIDEEPESLKQDMVEKYSQLILNVAFNPEAFAETNAKEILGEKNQGLLDLLK